MKRIIYLLFIFSISWNYTFSEDTTQIITLKKINYTIKERLIKSLKYLKFRNGKLATRRNEIIQDIIPILQPLDILVEKSSFLISDKFIPGHFGHVALWLGMKKNSKKEIYGRMPL